MNASLTLARYVSETPYEDLPGSALEAAKMSLLDALGVTLAAGTLGEGCQAFVDLAMAGGGAPESTILGFGARVPAPMAALANGAMAHALDFEDAHDSALVHPNAATVPAALAVAESLGDVSGKELLAALVLGCDVVCRLGLSLSRDLLEDGWYLPPVLGAFGAAAAASRLLRLPPAQVLDAFSLTLCQVTGSSELTRSPRSLVRSVRDAFSAQAGVLSALLAGRGVVGFQRPIDGDAGLLNLYARGAHDLTALTRGLGEVFEGSNVSFKPWPSCRGTHPYIEGALQIIEDTGLRPDAIEAVTATVGPVTRMLCEPADAKRRPRTAIDAKFSIPFVVATALVYRQVGLEHFAPDRPRNEEVLRIAARVDYRVDPMIGRAGATSGVLEIVTRSSAVHQCVVERPYGHPQHPLGRDGIVAKFMDCARYAPGEYSPRRLSALVETVLTLEEVDRIGTLVELLQAKREVHSS